MQRVLHALVIGLTAAGLPLLAPLIGTRVPLWLAGAWAALALGLLFVPADSVWRRRWLLAGGIAIALVHQAAAALYLGALLAALRARRGPLVAVLVLGTLVLPKSFRGFFEGWWSPVAAAHVFFVALVGVVD